MLKDTRVEQYLAHQFVAWEYRTVPIKALRLTGPEAGHYQPRITSRPLDEETLDLYTQALTQHYELPAIVINVRPDGTYDVLNGYHRAHAMIRVGRKEIDAYVLRVDEPTAAKISGALNSLETPRGSNRAERLAQALQLMRTQGYTVVAAAREAIISPHALQMEVAASEVAQRLKGHVDPATIATSTLARLNSVPTDAALVALARVVSESKLSERAIADVLAEIRRARSEEAQVAIVASFEQSELVRDAKQQAERGATHKPRTTRPSTQLWRGMGIIQGVLRKYPTPAALGMSKAEYALFQEEWLVLEAKVEEFCGAKVVLRGGSAAGNAAQAG